MIYNRDSSGSGSAPPSPDALASSENGVCNKRKRRPAGTPDPDAEVVSLSPRTLLESDRYVCEICNQGFQRDQNLQMHRRRHKVPWKLLKRETQEAKKKVFVCPEPSCLHHDPCHALGDLVGIKKHFRRKHSNQKQWVCDKCSKGYAVQSDYKAHLKTCGTRGHSCDCGRVFSRVESFIEHQDECTVRQFRPELPVVQPAFYSRTASSTCPSNYNNQPVLLTQEIIHKNNKKPCTYDHQQHRNLELQLLPSSNAKVRRNSEDNYETHLKLSIGSDEWNVNEPRLEVAKLKEFTSEELKLAMAEKAYAEEARREAKRQIEIAEVEFANAKRIRKQAQAELEKAEALKMQAMKKMSSTLMQITCQVCKQQFQSSIAHGVPSEETSLVTSYMSSPTTEGEGE
ncbi:hypothetical protein L6164_026578 [Bauhinia variegata]|uniref:Uncharacterized protein n=1 Tax=Bauhinia variegata TaxID=167791 RepID=A0ACB9LQD0_BAUVA|nr:hypothetical protein L6164_026578 [Bauhinia variegata]